MKQPIHGLLAVLALATALSSGCDQRSELTSPRGLQGKPALTSPTPTCQYPTSRSTASNYAPQFACDALVRIEVTATGGSVTSDMMNGVTSAQVEWNTVFGQYHLPTINAPVNGSQTAPKITVVFDLTLAGTYWCGSTSFSTHTITIARTTSGSCPLVDPSGQIRIVTGLSGLVKHEMSHALGFVKHLSNATGAPTTDCLSSVPPTGPFNETVCDHERQVVYWMYELRNSDPDLTQSMTAPTVALSPPAVTVDVGATQQFSATASQGTPQLNWSIDNAAIASFTSTSNTGATVQAAQTEGQAVVSAQIVETPTILWPTNSGTASLTVQRPPVASVTIAPNGVTLVGVDDTTLIATVVDVNGNVRTDVPLTWTVANEATVWFVPYAQSAWISAKRNGTTQITARAPNGVSFTITVTVQGCPAGCAA